MRNQTPFDAEESNYACDHAVSECTVFELECLTKRKHNEQIGERPLLYVWLK